MRVHIRTVAHVMDEMKIPNDMQKSVLARLIGMIEDDEMALMRNKFDRLRESLIGEPKNMTNGHVHVTPKKFV